MRAVAAIAAAAWLAIYLPEAGRGFIKDDFAWLLAAPLAPSPWDAAWTASTGFFRPLVSLSFTLNHALFGLAPLGYGLTNLLLALACAAAIYALARAWRIGAAGAAIAAFIWLFTPHGMDMAVIWISGRSALLLVLFGASACACFARGHRAAALALTAGALLSKDEAVVMPVLLAIGMAGAGRFDRRRDTAALAISVVLVALYFWMRTAAGAHMPWNAPVDYRPIYAPGHLAANALQYADRVLTFPLALTVLARLVMWGTRPGLTRTWIPGLMWAGAALIPTIALPVRSSLYTLLPLAGIAVAAGHLIEVLLARSDASHRRRTAIAAVAIVLVLIPIHRARQHEWSGAARLSAQITADVPAILRDAPAGSRVVVRDRFEQPNLESTFGNLLPEMLQIATGKRFELVAAPQGSAIALTPIPR